MKNWSTKNILIVSFGALLAIAFIAGGGFLQGTPLEKPLMTIGPIIILFLMIYVPFVIIRLIYRKISKSKQCVDLRRTASFACELLPHHNQQIIWKKKETPDKDVSVNSTLFDRSGGWILETLTKKSVFKI